MKIFIDNGHGIETPGKRSPDGLFLEYQYNRLIASRVTAELLDCGYDASLLVPEDSDVSLAERCQRVNAVCDEVGVGNVILCARRARGTTCSAQMGTARSGQIGTGYSAQ